MNSLFWKGMLAFLVVIVVAVGTVAALTGRLTESAFRRYALARSGMWDQTTERLATYYERRGSWAGLQEVLETLIDRRQHMRGGREGMMGGPPGMMIDFRIADRRGQVVADTQGPPRGSVSRTQLNNGIPITAGDETVGYLVPASVRPPNWPLDAAQAAFLVRMRRILWIAILAALGVALIIGGVLFRSITAPLRQLTTAAQAIATGDLSARAPVRGEDEIGQLSAAFNQMAESLDRMEQARRHQTADIAHELRTPLTVLQGTLEAMSDGVYAANQENLQAALAQTRTLSRLIEDLRILALADAGRLELHQTRLDLASFLHETVESHHPQAREEGIALTLEPLPALPPLSADRDRLTQVMGNLISNALRYVPEGGHVAVRARREPDSVVVTVADDGPGVPAEDLPRLFERFWRADRARRRATGGSGLGLSIARHIVEAHGGRIWAEETPGGGLTISFTLPVDVGRG
jgi:signal transduction histidine kinase